MANQQTLNLLYEDEALVHLHLTCDDVLNCYTWTVKGATGPKERSLSMGRLFLSYAAPEPDPLVQRWGFSLSSGGMKVTVMGLRRRFIIPCWSSGQRVYSFLAPTHRQVGKVNTREGGMKVQCG